jgi:ferredoxin
MPIITAQGKTISCAAGANLRQTLMAAGIDLHNGQSRVINCRGLGSCGTCAVEIGGAPEAISEPNWRDLTRRSLPPHDRDRPLRLACQTRVYGDVQVTKYEGFWGQGETPRWTPQA